MIGHEGAFVGDRRGSSWTWEDLAWGYGTEISALSYADNLVEATARPGRAALRPRGPEARAGLGLPERRLDRLHDGSPPALRRGDAAARARLERRALHGAAAARRRLGRPPRGRGSGELHGRGVRLGARGEGHRGRFGCHDVARRAARGRARARRLRRPADGGDGQGRQQGEPEPARRDAAAARRPEAERRGQRREGRSRRARDSRSASTSPRRAGRSRTAPGCRAPTSSTPAGLAALLAAMDRHPHAAAFRDSLPIAGVDGTLETRMRGTPAEKRVLAKTGTSQLINALAGYVTTRARRAARVRGRSSTTTPAQEPRGDRRDRPRRDRARGGALMELDASRSRRASPAASGIGLVARRGHQRARGRSGARRRGRRRVPGAAGPLRRGQERRGARRRRRAHALQGARPRSHQDAALERGAAAPRPEGRGALPHQHARGRAQPLRRCASSCRSGSTTSTASGRP